MVIKHTGAKWLAMAIWAAVPLGATAATFDLGDDRSISLGLALRYSYTNADSPNGTANAGHSTDYHLDSGRFLLGASFSKSLKVTLNTERKVGRTHVLDAFAQFEPMPEFNIWAGRLVSPSDRANMAGPYYSMGGGYWPSVASRYGWYGGKFVARDDGAVVWGMLADGRLGYSLGAFEGHTYGIGSLTWDQSRKAGVKASYSPMYAGRLQYDFWDRAPGYYNIANFLGEKDILSVGAAFRYQDQGVLTQSGKGDYTGVNLDFLMEKRFAGLGALAIEGAWYDYNTDGVLRAEQGRAYSSGVSFILAQKMGWGRLQPYAHWQKFEADNHVDTDQYDLGVNYIIDGYNTQLSATWTRTEVDAPLTAQSKRDKFVVALQLQF